MELTYTQCKQIISNGLDLREELERLRDQPEWLEYELSIADIQAIQQGGCASGAYMPAVTYHKAVDTMSEHGDDVLDHIESVYGEIPQPNKGESWGGIAVFYLALSIDTWCLGFDLDGVNWD